MSHCKEYFQKARGYATGVNDVRLKVFETVSPSDIFGETKACWRWFDVVPKFIPKFVQCKLLYNMIGYSICKIPHKFCKKMSNVFSDIRRNFVF